MRKRKDKTPPRTTKEWLLMSVLEEGGLREYSDIDFEKTFTGKQRDILCVSKLMIDWVKILKTQEDMRKTIRAMMDAINGTWIYCEKLFHETGKDLSARVWKRLKHFDALHGHDFQIGPDRALVHISKCLETFVLAVVNNTIANVRNQAIDFLSVLFRYACQYGDVMLVRKEQAA